MPTPPQISSGPEAVPVLEFYAGDTYVFPTFTFTENDVPLDLSAYSWKAQWRKTDTATEFVEIALDLSQSAVGVIKPSLTASQTEGMVGAGVWDLQSTLAGVVRTWIRGATQVTKDVTVG